MGVGRRMKKQGPPAPLDESRISSLKKRKHAEGDADVVEKRRRTSGEKRTNSGGRAAGKTHAEGSRRNKPKKEKAANGKPLPVERNGTAKTKSKKAEKTPLPADDDDGFGSFGLDDDVSDGIGSIGLAEKDEFLGSGSSVYDSDEQNKAVFSEDEGDSDAEEQLTAANIEGLSRRLDDQQEEDAAQAQAELEESAMQTNIVGDRPKVLEEADEEGQRATLAPDLQMLRTRITDTVRVLDDFAKLAEEGRSRADYTGQLLKDICAYYGYSAFLAEKLFNLFPPREAFAFFEANETARPVVIRTNTLRTHRRDLAQALINRGVTLEPVGKWSKVGLQVFESQVPLGATPEYLAGHYILQAASSFLPVMALAPQEHERVLDMAAAPGGKTTYMAALMKNTGCIFANDSNKTRAKGLIGNIHRLGAKNTIVCSHDAREFPKVIGGFDRVLLDAPCSGTGVISKDASVKTNKTEKDFLLLPHLQRQLLLAAIDSADHASKTGGSIVYSTCSVTVEENESVVQYALGKRPNVKLVETGLVFGVPGFTSYMGKTFSGGMKLTRRYYPHTYNVDGFFVAKLRKTAPSPATASERERDARPEVDGVHKAPIPETPEAQEAQDAFGGWNESEDEAYIERSRRAALRRKGVDPRGVKGRRVGHGEVVNGGAPATKEVTLRQKDTPSRQGTKDGREANEKKDRPSAQTANGVTRAPKPKTTKRGTRTKSS
ncbi:MAG: rRNA (cytosine-C5-)-methyltransferase nop2 [Thelocarpon impressellum]|nr:MAG: rRNA (cytosine-C5-)-methyltransferase nop2 [Thelocarpon impressellum]